MSPENQNTSDKPDVNMPPQTQPVEVNSTNPDTSPSSQAMPNTPQNTTVVNSSKPKSKKLLVILLAVFVFIIISAVAVIALIGFVAINATNEPKKVSDNFMNYLQSSDSNSAYMLTNSQFQKATTKSDLKDLFDKVSPYFKGDEKVLRRTVKKASDGKSYASIVYEVNNTKKYYLKVVLIENGNNWEVLNFRYDDKPIDYNIE